MYSLVLSASVFGIDAFIVEIETHIDNAVPNFIIVGLPDSAIKESRERVMAAIKNSGFVFPSKRYTVNLAPADVKKEGSAFDLPIAIGILTSLEMIPARNLDKTIILGELSLEGQLRPIHGVLSIAMEAKKSGMDLKTTYEAIKISSGNSFVHETESQVILNGSYNISFTMDLVVKDVGFFDNLSKKHHIPLEVSPIVFNIFKEGQKKYGSRAWSSMIVKRLEDACNINLRAEGFPSELTDNESEEKGYVI